MNLHDDVGRKHQKRSVDRRAIHKEANAGDAFALALALTFAFAFAFARTLALAFAPTFGGQLGFGAPCRDQHGPEQSPDCICFVHQQLPRQRIDIARQRQRGNSAVHKLLSASNGAVSAVKRSAID